MVELERGEVDDEDPLKALRWSRVEREFERDEGIEELKVERMD